MDAESDFYITIYIYIMIYRGILVKELRPVDSAQNRDNLSATKPDELRIAIMMD